MYTIFISSFHANVSFDATTSVWILIKRYPFLEDQEKWRTQPMSCKKTLPIWNVWCENESCKKENSQSSSLRPIQWHELRVMFFSLPCGAAQQHLHLRCELRSIHCQYMPLLLWTASFAPVPEIRISHWICVDNLTRRSNSYRFCSASTEQYVFPEAKIAHAQVAPFL